MTKIPMSAVCLTAVFLLSIANMKCATASPYTPTEWQGENSQHFDRTLRTQRKHTTWSRDRNRNFIDDVIDEADIRRDERINVVVDLNRALTEPEIHDLFSSYGR